MKPSLIWALALVVLLGTGCKKDDTKTDSGPSAKATLLTSKRWTLSDVTIQKSGSAIIEHPYNDMEGCDKDNFLRFNADHSAVVDEGLQRCGPADPQTYSGSWELTANETRLLLTTPLYGTGVATNPDLVELSASRMVLRGTLIDAGVVMTYVATMTGS